MEQGWCARDAARRSDGTLDRVDAYRQFRRDDRRWLWRPGQSAGRHQQIPPRSANPENYGNFDDPAEVALYDKMLREPDPAKQRELMRQFEKHVMDDEAHELMTLWWYRIAPYRSEVKGWHISPSHFLGNSLAAVWLDK